MNTHYSLHTPRKPWFSMESEVFLEWTDCRYLLCDWMRLARAPNTMNCNYTPMGGWDGCARTLTPSLLSLISIIYQRSTGATPRSIVCSLQENLTLHWFPMESEVFFEWTDYGHKRVCIPQMNEPTINAATIALRVPSIITHLASSSTVNVSYVIACKTHTPGSHLCDSTCPKHVL